MEKLTKSSSGLLFREDFGGDISLIWDLIPNNLDRVEFLPNSIKLLPGESRIELIMPTPKDAGWLFQTHITYEPRATTESGGFILKSITDNIAECELKGDTRELYKYLKMELTASNIFFLRASNDGVEWRDFGNSKMLDSHMFGFYINELTRHDALEIHNAIVCSSGYFTVNGIPENGKIKIYDQNHNEITHRFTLTKGDHHIAFDCANHLYPIDYLKFELLNENGDIVLESYATDIYGGDVYNITHNVKFSVNGTAIDGDYYNLGVIDGFYELFSLQVENLESHELTNRLLKIEAYSSYNPGNIPVLVAQTTTIDDLANLEFKKELSVTLRPFDIKNFYIKIERDSNLILIDNEYRFKISLL